MSLPLLVTSFRAITSANYKFRLPSSFSLTLPTTPIQRGGWFKKKTTNMFNIKLNTKNVLLLIAALVCVALAFAMQDVSGFAMAYFPFAAVGHTDGESNMPGTRITAYFCPIAGITTFPSRVAVPTTNDERIRLQGTYVCAAQMNFVALYLSYKSGTFKAEPVGDIDGGAYNLSAELFHPGSKDEVAGFAAAILNTPGVLILIEENGERLVMGSDIHPCYIKGAFDLGKATPDRKGFTFTAESISDNPLTRYHGVIPISGSSVPAIS